VPRPAQRKGSTRPDDRQTPQRRNSTAELLNDLPGYNYRTADKDEERAKVRKFCDEHILKR
jgi:hypothetical protein